MRDPPLHVVTIRPLTDGGTLAARIAAVEPPERSWVGEAVGRE
jgi:hypothetical protein